MFYSNISLWRNVWIFSKLYFRRQTSFSFAYSSIFVSKSMEKISSSKTSSSKSSSTLQISFNDLSSFTKKFFNWSKLVSIKQCNAKISFVSQNIEWSIQVFFRRIFTSWILGESWRFVDEFIDVFIVESNVFVDEEIHSNEFFIGWSSSSL